MDIVVNKLSEYFSHTDSKLAGDVISNLSR